MMFTNKIIETNSKEGQELLEYLKKKITIPLNCIRFKLSFKVDDWIRIEDCEYYPEMRRGE